MILVGRTLSIGEEAYKSEDIRNRVVEMIGMSLIADIARRHPTAEPITEIVVFPWEKGEIQEIDEETGEPTGEILGYYWFLAAECGIEERGPVINLADVCCVDDDGDVIFRSDE